MNLFHTFLNYIIDCLISWDSITDLRLPNRWKEKITLEPSRDSKHGDLATNAAMILAKPLQKSPKAIAEQLIPKLLKNSAIANAEVAGPGFINLTLKPEVWYEHLQYILDKGTDYGSSTLGSGQKVNIEFVSANPTGPMHTGHGRNAILGDTIASLLSKVGYSVCREYYVNDAGGQVDILARSVYLRYLQACGEHITDNDFTQGMYPGDYLIPIAEKILNKDGKIWIDQSENMWIEHFRNITISEMLDLIRQDLDLLGVKMDVFTSEKSLVDTNQIVKALKTLEDKNDVYQGTLEPPKGHVIEDWEPRPQTLFCATKYGDDIDRPLKKSDNTWTYFAGDIAYHSYKYQRGFTHLINIFGADHSGYVKRIKAAVQAITNNKANFEIKVCQMVNFLDKGMPVKMSKRAGTFITIKNVIDRVGKDATRYMMVSRHQDMPIDFDFSKVIEQTRDNPMFYIQYAHARIHSVLRHAQEIFPILNTTNYTDINFHLLNDENELNMIKQLVNWPQQVETAAQVREPHRIATFIYDVSSIFHALWNKGKDHTYLRFINAQDYEGTKARLGLLIATANVIASGLQILGITPIKEMR